MTSSNLGETNHEEDLNVSNEINHNLCSMPTLRTLKENKFKQMLYSGRNAALCLKFDPPDRAKPVIRSRVVETKFSDFQNVSLLTVMTMLNRDI